MENVHNMTREELIQYLEKQGGKKYHAEELFRWIYEKKIKKFTEITNIKKELLTQLENDFLINEIEIVHVERDKDVNKYLFVLSDSEHVEAVLMRHDYGRSICISSQVGCNMGCKFCESGRRKKVRNLTAGEMVEQIIKVEEDIQMRISHVVIMGIGEPFDNYENVTKFISIINDPKGLQIGSRHITVSTCGIIPKIEKFADFPYQVNLAISLHAPTDALRSSLMPINKVYPLKDLIASLKKYSEKTSRRITFEYILLKDLNDQEEHAISLAKLIKGMNAYVNLIPYNTTDNLEFLRSDAFQIMKFYDILKKNHINVTIRREFGSKISAACGQLRSKKEDL